MAHRPGPWPLALLVVAAAACGRPAAAPGPAAPAGPGPVASNVFRADYAGSSACKDCHPKIYASWARSPMRNMTRLIDGATVRAPFDGATLTVGADTVTMYSEAGARFMRVRGRGHDLLFRVTKVVGGRYREDFIGINVSDQAHPETATGWGGERVLPATYVFSTKTWRYKGYSVMVHERPYTSTRAVWSETCLACHNTLPYVTLLYDDLYGRRLPGYQGKVTDHLLPPARSWRAIATDAAALAREIDGEIATLGATPPPDGAPLRRVLHDAAIATRKRLRTSHLVEVGIGCEACHGGAAAHARDPKVEPTFEPTSPVLHVAPTRPPVSRAQWINHTCARCHTVLFSRYPWTWEGGRRTDPMPGGSTTTSGEARDFQLGGCASQMACTTCHDPHTADPRAKLDALGTPAGNPTCTRCHAQYASAKALEAHSHHPAGSAGASCVGCHMPKKNMGLDYVLDRYHRIGSPDDRLRVERDRPLECALCHVDKSVGELVTTMERWWGKRFDRGALRGLYGDDLSVDALDATLARGKAHEQAAAIASLGAAATAGGDGAMAVAGRATARREVPHILPSLWHEYPLVRFYARHALEQITGVPVPIDPDEPAARIQDEARRWLAAWNAHAPDGGDRAPTPPPSPHAEAAPDGNHRSPPR